ncbi:GAF domain-containing protein [Amnibacterium sp. CER49]|uniref:GAF domain-containing protein n=1 Tax=Amnibacterium sp. CER49 TaxID=3039161 RepID=UPI002449B4B2|nr:GAF domain-containing protein [Amnibacterium sp. CER49]MDH2442916.1 GAF domain-containing protein [Amnibacterium sp. CER49]
MRGVLWGAFAVRRLHRTGAGPQRVLVLGSRSLLRAQDRRRALAQLPEDLADRLWLSTRRGIDVDVVWELRSMFRAVLNGLTALRISRYDAVVLLSAAESDQSSRARIRIDRLRAAILGQMSPAGQFLAVVLGDERAAAKQAEAGRSSGAAPILAALETPKAAAAAIARRLQLTTKPDTGHDADRSDGSGDEVDADRARAVEALSLRDRPDDEVLQRIVEQAGERFGTRFAELNIIGRDVQWSLAAAGLHRGERSTEKSLCGRAIQRSGPTILHDTLREMPVDDIPRVADGRLVRFYAGHPIQSIGGHRIGVLCVYDTRPHRLLDDDVDALRDLALLTEARVIGA